MKLSHALLLTIKRGQNASSAAGPWLDTSDTVLTLEPHKKEKGSAIGIFIEDIRMIQGAVRTATKHKRTIVQIVHAETMTAQAQNALLKFLEEPRDNLYFILITPTPHVLLDTVRSRCQAVSAIPPSSPVPVPEDRKSKIDFMSDGNISEAQKLVRDENYYEEQETRFSQAKTLLVGSRLDRLKVVASLKESRQEALEIIHASLVFSRYLLMRQPANDLIERAQKLLEAERNLQKNGNVRLWLLACVV